MPGVYLHVCCIHYELCFIILGEMVPPKDFIEAIMGESLKDSTLKQREFVAVGRVCCLSQSFKKHGRILRL